MRRALVMAAAVTASSAAWADEELRLKMAALAMANIVFENCGVGQAIEVVCPGWEVTPELQAGLHIFGQAFDDKAVVMRKVALGMAKAAQDFNLKGDRKGFCARALKVHGPDGDPPKVSRKKP